MFHAILVDAPLGGFVNPVGKYNLERRLSFSATELLYDRDIVDLLANLTQEEEE